PVRRGGDAVIAGSGVARTGLGALAARWSAWRTDLATAASGGDPDRGLVPEPLPPFERETGQEAARGGLAAAPALLSPGAAAVAALGAAPDPALAAEPPRA